MGDQCLPDNITELYFFPEIHSRTCRNHRSALYQNIDRLKMWYVIVTLLIMSVDIVQLASFNTNNCEDAVGEEGKIKYYACDSASLFLLHNTVMDPVLEPNGITCGDPVEPFCTLVSI